MLHLVFNGIIFGVLLSFLIGPIFFVLLETSIKKGLVQAIFLDIGVLLSDILYLLASFYVAKEINQWLNDNSFVKYIAGGVFIILGLISIFKKQENNKSTIIDSDIIKPSKKGGPYFKKRILIGLIAKGMGLNAINPGVLVYWIAACTYATEELQVENSHLIYYFGATLLTMFSIDLIKIYFANKLKTKVTNKSLRYLSIAVGCALMVFGLAICFKDSI